MELALGILLVVLGGLIMGSLGWPMKLMRNFQFEHYWFIGMLFGLFIVPWTITLTMCPNALQAYSSVPIAVLLKSNLFSLSWGICNVMLGICFVRIGISLSFAILTAIGASLGVTIPMVIKASGSFSESAGLTSPAGKMVLFGVAVMLIGIVFVAVAGFGRERSLKNVEGSQKTGGFLSGLIMSVIAGILSCGISFAFVYSQGPVVEAMKAQGASDTPAIIAVWAAGLIAGGLANILYPAFLMTKNRSWSVLVKNSKELALSLIIGANFIVAVSLMGKGMILIGSLGASIGFGVQQSMQILGAQAVGFISGEWKNVHSKCVRLMVIGIVILLLAGMLMAYGNTLPKG